MSSVPLPSYLLFTHKGYFFRLRVPRHLQEKIGKRELKKAIAGADRQLAERQAILYASRAFALFEALEDTPLSIYRNDMVFHVPGGTKIVIDPARRKEELQDLLELGIINKADTSSQTAPPECELAPASRQPSIHAPESNENYPVYPSMLLSQAVEAYIDDLDERKGGKLDESAKKELRSKSDLLIKIIGDKPIGSITYMNARKYRSTLYKLPRNRTSKIYKDMPLDEQMACTKPKLKANTVAQRLDTMRGMFEWFKEVYPSLPNPFTRVTVQDDENDMDKKQPFNSDDLIKIFSDKIWTKKEYLHLWEYWFPLLLLYSGARTTEVCQLERGDFVTVDGIWCMSINDIPTKDEPEEAWTWDKRLKTKQSRRKIPIHSHLLALGLKKFVDAAAPGRLFPNIKPVANRLAHRPCKRFNEVVLPRTGVKVPYKKTFYSFRHTALNCLKQQRVQSEERAQLAGHATEKRSTTEIVYGEEYQVAIMKELVEMLDFSEATKSVSTW